MSRRTKRSSSSDAKDLVRRVQCNTTTATALPSCRAYSCYNDEYCCSYSHSSSYYNCCSNDYYHYSILTITNIASIVTNITMLAMLAVFIIITATINRIIRKPCKTMLVQTLNRKRPDWVASPKP